MMLINFFDNIIDGFFLCIETKYRHFKLSITARNEKQQLEYIYELNFHDKEAKREEINKTFQWIDVDGRDQFKLLSIRNTKKKDLELFYLEMATILQTQDMIKDLQNGIFMCVGNFIDLVYQDINPQIDYLMDPQMNQQNKKILIFEKILRYAQMRFEFADAEHFQKSHVNKIFEKQIFSFDLDQTVTFELFYSKQYDLRNSQDLIFKQQNRTKRYFINGRWRKYCRGNIKSRKITVIIIHSQPKTYKSYCQKYVQQIAINLLTRNIQYLQLEQPPNWQGKIIDQLKQIKEIALKYNLQADFANIQNLLHQQINQDSLNLINQAIQSFQEKIKQNLVMYQNFPALKSDLNSWAQLFKDLKTRWNNKQLIFQEQEFVETLEQILLLNSMFAIFIFLDLNVIVQEISLRYTQFFNYFDRVIFVIFHSLFFHLLPNVGIILYFSYLIQCFFNRIINISWKKLMKLFKWISEQLDKIRNMISIKDEKQILEYIYELHYQESTQDIQNNRPQINEIFQWLDQEINNKEVFLRQCNIKNSDNMQLEKFYYYLAFIGSQSSTISTQLQGAITAHIQEQQKKPKQQKQQIQQNEFELQQLRQHDDNEDQEQQNQNYEAELINLQENLFDFIVSYIMDHYDIKNRPIKKKYLNRVMQKKIFYFEGEDLTFDEFQTKLEKFPMELEDKIKHTDLKSLINNGNQLVQRIGEELEVQGRDQEIPEAITKAKAQVGGEIIKEILKLESEIRNIHHVSIKDITDVESKYKRLDLFKEIFERENNKNNWNELIKKIQITLFEEEKIKKNGFIEFMDQIL
ncbi:hypothetical protein pb186bvf_002073 [Paramecium bursaria]